jgi:hypothetical protein
MNIRFGFKTRCDRKGASLIGIAGRRDTCRMSAKTHCCAMFAMIQVIYQPIARWLKRGRMGSTCLVLGSQGWGSIICRC